LGNFYRQSQGRSFFDKVSMNRKRVFGPNCPEAEKAIRQFESRQTADLVSQDSTERKK
jgi:hypothetical protein